MVVVVVVVVMMLVVGNIVVGVCIVAWSLPLSSSLSLSSAALVAGSGVSFVDWRQRVERSCRRHAFLFLTAVPRFVPEIPAFASAHVKGGKHSNATHAFVP